jgi:hypothetical protein
MLYGAASIWRSCWPAQAFAPKRYLWAYGLDCGTYQGLGGGNFQKDIPLALLAEGGVLLAYEINGASFRRSVDFRSGL